MQPSLRPVKISTVTFMPLWRAWVSVRLISTVYSVTPPEVTPVSSFRLTVPS